MRLCALRSTVVLMLSVIAAPAIAQTRSTERRSTPVPAPDQVAVGFSAGFAMPSASGLDTGMGISAQIERYLTSRASLRGQLSGAWTDVFAQPFEGSVKPMAVNGNLVYNWEGGKIHPYVTGGVGFYRYRFSEAGLTGASNKLGTNVGGGAEVFFTRRDALTVEALAHVVPGTVTSTLTTYEPSYWTLGFGYKMYFGK